MLRDAGLKHVQPDTVLYSRAALLRFLRSYRTVFLKPDRGYGGSGVISIQKRDKRYEVIEQSRYRSFTDDRKLFKWIDSYRRGRPFIIQQGINLQPLSGSPVDIRTIIQKDRQGDWEVTAMFAKAAKKGKVVTNVKAGGRVLSVPRYLGCIAKRGDRRLAKIRQLKTFTQRIAHVFQRHYTNRLYALDIGMDRNQKLWLIEVNTHPSFSILKKIDRRMYQHAIALRRPLRRLKVTRKPLIRGKRPSR